MAYPGCRKQSIAAEDDFCRQTHEELNCVQGACQVGGERQGGASTAETATTGSAADETRGHVCGVRKMAGEYSGEEGDGNKVLQGVDAMEEASGGAVPWGLEAIDSGGGAERPDDGSDHKTDAASKPIVCDGPVAAKCAGLEAGASRGGEEARYHAADREADAESGQGIGI